MRGKFFLIEKALRWVALFALLVLTLYWKHQQRPERTPENLAFVAMMFGAYYIPRHARPLWDDGRKLRAGLIIAGWFALFFYWVYATY